MRQQTTPRTLTFSARTSWVGVLLLGAGLSQITLPPGQASSPGPQTASIEFSAFDDFFGVLSGGRQTEFTTGTKGWQGPAFESLGMMGIEWTTALQKDIRQDISPDPGTANPSPGGESSWTTPGYLSANPINQIFTEKTVSLSGNQVRFSMRHRSLGDESAINRRLFWIAELATGYDPVYSGAGTSNVVITDASGAHPTIIMNVTTTAGTATFEGGKSLHTPLVNGDRTPTMYVIPGSSTDFTMEITVGIVDADPCSASAASSFAASQGGVFGKVWTSLTSCGANAAWTLTADGEKSGPLSLDFDSPYAAPSPPATRTLDIQGLPQGVTWERAEDSGASLQVRFTAPTTVPPGTYALAWYSADSLNSGGVTSLSRPSSGAATLSVIVAPSPPPTPEPEPEPEPQPQAEPEKPLLIPAPETPPGPQPEPQPETPVLVTTVEPDRESEPTKVAPEASSPSKGSAQSPPEPVVIPEPETPVTVPVPVPVDRTPDVPLILPLPMEAVPEPPSALSLERVPRSVGELGPEIPEPLAASAWLGLGAGLLASGGIIAALRRRFRRAGAARSETTKGID